MPAPRPPHVAAQDLRREPRSWYHEIRNEKEGIVVGMIILVGIRLIGESEDQPGARIRHGYAIPTWIWVHRAK